ncbi:hypothetical protein [Stenotrophomonas sp. NPDC077659]|uniref:hypothetical protein n=1 Tax=Stenotrophomonas sp. NPDC077659 TaxID=3390694 RepID=UPI003D03C5BA
MPMLALLLLHALLSSVGIGGVDAGPALPASGSRLCLQLHLGKDSLLQWERSEGGTSHALAVSHQINGHWQLRHRFSLGRPAVH